MVFTLMQILSLPTFSLFIQEMAVFVLVFVVNSLKKQYKDKQPEAIFEGLILSLIILMPLNAFFNFLVAIQIPIYGAVITYILSYVAWIVYLSIRYKEELPKKLIIMFVALMIFQIIIFGTTYNFFR